MSDAIKQLSFHVDLNGCPVPEPAYARKVREENAKPIPFPVSYTKQLVFLFPEQEEVAA